MAMQPVSVGCMGFAFEVSVCCGRVDGIGFDDDVCLELVGVLVIVIGESILRVFLVDLFLFFVSIVMRVLFLYF